jgi:hypothetical protein
MTTVGYGDKYPENHYGRSVVIFGALFGILIYSIFILIIDQKIFQFTLAEQEVKALELIDKKRDAELEEYM